MAAGSTRVLVLTNMYPPHHYGGYELSCRDVAERWRARDWEVEVLTTAMRVPGVADPPHEPEAGVRRELEWYWDDHELTSPSRWRRVLIERANQRRLAHALRDHRPDVISIWNMGAMSFGLLATLVASRVPLVYVVCDDWLIYGRRLDAWTRMFRSHPRLGRILAGVTRVPTDVPDLGASGAFCFVSETTRDRAEEHSGWHFADATVVYSGIDMDDFPMEPVGERPWRGRLLYVGRIDDRKGIDTAIRALARLGATTSLEIVGQGDKTYLAHLRALITSLGLQDRVSFSSVERALLAARYRSADVLVFPSMWTEPFGLVPLEAMACGTPVIATGVGGSGEYLVDGVNCLLVPPGDDQALAERVEALSGDEVLRGRLAAGGQDTASGLSVDRLADVLEHWHLSAAQRGANLGSGP